MIYPNARNPATLILPRRTYLSHYYFAQEATPGLHQHVKCNEATEGRGRIGGGLEIRRIGKLTLKRRVGVMMLMRRRLLVARSRRIGVLAVRMWVGVLEVSSRRVQVLVLKGGLGRLQEVSFTPPNPRIFKWVR